MITGGIAEEEGELTRVGMSVFIELLCNLFRIKLRRKDGSAYADLANTQIGSMRHHLTKEAEAGEESERRGRGRTGG